MMMSSSTSPPSSPKQPTPTTTTSSRSSTSRRTTHTKCLLALLGVLVGLLTISSLWIGHYYHNQYYANDSLADMPGATSMHVQLQKPDSSKSVRGKGGDMDIISSEGGGGAQSTTKNKNNNNNNNNNIELDPTHERSVFQSIIDRVQWTKQQCDSIPSNQKNTLPLYTPITDLPMLPEGGVAPALQKWLNDNNYPLNNEQRFENNNDKGSDSTTTTSSYPTCHLPPTTSCHVSTYTLIIMSHTTGRLHDFMNPLATMIDTWPGLTEVIIVWNSPRETLTSVSEEDISSIEARNKKNADRNKALQEQKYAQQLLAWNDDASHPLRIFYSLENGLENNLLNRYHPKLQPKNEVVMYFDDDGPFWSKESMIDAGLELWKRNSNVQVGGFPRNIRHLSKRMNDLGRRGVEKSMELVVNNVHGDDYFHSGSGNQNGETKLEYPRFTPLCRNTTGDTLEYNFFVFPDFDAHVLLPSGSFLHRNFLCFIWHPALEELRNYVVTHKTYPDDITVSTLVSHLSGRAPRTFPREVVTVVNDGNKRRLGGGEEKKYDVSKEEQEEKVFEEIHAAVNQSHRRLLWKQKNWGKMREEAINSLTGYFGSIHPGTVGWCAGTKNMKKNNRGVPYVCNPEKPTLDLIPWLVEGGPGFDHCPKK